MFSYDDYREIIRLIKASGRAADYEEALHRDSFIIMRHDVEYSVDRAYALSKVEESEDFHSTYFFQWTNNSYNILSRKNRDIVTDMHERGHNIGLHFALNGMTDMNLIREQIRKEMEMLSTMFGFEVKWFSIHRPSPAVLKENIKFPGIINAYQDNFFTFNPNVTADTVFTAQFTAAPRKYNITWEDWDGTLLRVDQVAYGETPVYGEAPTRAPDVQYTYAFSGWSPSTEPVAGEAVYAAQ